MKVKINCADFYGNPFGNYMFKLLDEHYELEITQNPDILLYSNAGRDFLAYRCLRVFYTGENVRPNFNECDYAFSFDYSDNPKNYRFPDYAAYCDVKQLTKHKQIVESLRAKTSFCNFIYSNPIPQERIEFFKLLSQYKKVDSFGNVLNNMPTEPDSADRSNPDWEHIKLKFMKRHKFSIVFENESYPGYTTEKILHAFLANTIPIYWGNPLIAQEFNPNSFINCHDFSSFDKVMQRVIEIDQDDSLYQKMLAEPSYPNNQIPENLRVENLLKQLDAIIQQIGKMTPVAQQTLSVRTAEPAFHKQSVLLRNRYHRLKYLTIPNVKARLSWFSRFMGMVHFGKNLA